MADVKLFPKAGSPPVENKDAVTYEVRKPRLRPSEMPIYGPGASQPAVPGAEASTPDDTRESESGPKDANTPEAVPDETKSNPHEFPLPDGPTELTSEVISEVASADNTTENNVEVVVEEEAQDPMKSTEHDEDPTAVDTQVISDLESPVIVRPDTSKPDNPKAATTSKSASKKPNKKPDKKAAASKSRKR